MRPGCSDRDRILKDRIRIGFRTISESGLHPIRQIRVALKCSVDVALLTSVLLSFLKQLSQPWLGKSVFSVTSCLASLTTPFPPSFFCEGKCSFEPMVETSGHSETMFSTSMFLETPFGVENRAELCCCEASRPPLCFDHTIHRSRFATSLRHSWHPNFPLSETLATTWRLIISFLIWMLHPNYKNLTFYSLS